MGGSRVDVVVSNSGWHSVGNGNVVTVKNAKTYNHNLIKNMCRISGTPKRLRKSLETYLLALFNEDLKPVRTEQNFGLYNPDMNEVYHVDFIACLGYVLGVIFLGFFLFLTILLGCKQRCTSSPNQQVIESWKTIKTRLVPSTIGEFAKVVGRVSLKVAPFVRLPIWPATSLPPPVSIIRQQCVVFASLSDGASRVKLWCYTVVLIPICSTSASPLSYIGNDIATGCSSEAYWGQIAYFRGFGSRFESTRVVVQDGPLGYMSLLDAIVDVVYSA
ncbi:hypothetical protein Syun_000978 [Stephania yunnanensis]|uniref:Uncharacterized protein n=1 Tax=Stephania yunnanensis TaxID=152371 RepID=A0AAP0LCX4_9MAGN